jgi:hypothetical protein
MTAPRLQLQNAIKPLLPNRWLIKPTSAKTDNVAAPVVQFQQTRIEKLAAAPRGKFAVEFMMTVKSGKEQTQAAENELDTLIIELLYALTKAGIVWRDCDKRVFDNQTRLGYELTVTITTDPKES